MKQRGSFFANSGELHFAGVTGVLLVSAAILAVFIFLVIPAVLPNHVCVFRSIADQGAGRVVTLHVDVTALKKPSSFLIEETVPRGTAIAQVTPPPLFYNNATGKISWLFWRGGSPVRDMVLQYTITSPQATPTGKLISGQESSNPAQGYKVRVIGPTEVCV